MDNRIPLVEAKIVNIANTSKPEFYKDKIAYSWVKGPDEVSTNSLSSGDMLAVIKLAMIASKQNNRPFTFTYDIALDMILKEKEKNKNEHRSNK